MTYAYALLDVSPAVYDEVRAKLIDAGHRQAIHREGDEEVIDMRGLALQRTDAPPIDVRVVDLYPDDVLVFSRPTPVTQEECDYLQESFPDRRVLILSDGLDLSVVRPTNPEKIDDV